MRLFKPFSVITKTTNLFSCAKSNVWQTRRLTKQRKLWPIKKNSPTNNFYPSWTLIRSRSTISLLYFMSTVSFLWMMNLKVELLNGEYFNNQSYGVYWPALYLDLNICKSIMLVMEVFPCMILISMIVGLSKYATLLLPTLTLLFSHQAISIHLKL